MTSASDPPLPPRVVSCPACGGRSLYGRDNPHRPFCSARCRGIDLGAWANEQFRLPSAPPQDDQDPRDDRPLP